MRQAMEAEVLKPHFELGEQGLHQVLSDVIEEVRHSVSQDIDGAEILHSLLTSSWLQSLLKVYECLQRYLRDFPAPMLDYASGLSLQLLIDLRSLPCCSEEAKELCRLLRQPHLQALLSAHDTVAQKDYEPVLPPIPDGLPGDEEATRTVCLVKNKQPLFFGTPRTKSLWSGIGSVQKIQVDNPFALPSPCVENGRCFSCYGVRNSSFQPTELQNSLAEVGSYPPPRYEVGCQHPISRCGVCYSDLLLDERLNHYAPSIYDSVQIVGENTEDEGDSDDEAVPSTSSLSHPFYPNVCGYLQPSLPRNLQSPRVHTAPPSPMCPRRRLDENPVELAKQESLDELRMTVRLAASSMDSSTKDIKVLGTKMAAATELMTETVQSLVLLTQGVGRLQTLLTASKAELNTSKPSEQSATQQSRCSSSCSSNSSLDTTSQIIHHLSVSPHESMKSKTSPLQQKKHKHTDLDVSKCPLTNGVLDELNSGKGSNQLKKKKKRRKKPK